MQSFLEIANYHLVYQLELVKMGAVGKAPSSYLKEYKLNKKHCEIVI